MCRVERTIRVAWVAMALALVTAAGCGGTGQRRAARPSVVPVWTRGHRVAVAPLCHGVSVPRVRPTFAILRDGAALPEVCRTEGEPDAAVRDGRRLLLFYGPGAGTTPIVLVDGLLRFPAACGGPLGAVDCRAAPAR